MRLLTIPYSTNAERVLLALAFKGEDVELVFVDPDDRSPVRAVSGQDLVPVLVDGPTVVHDSPAILRYLEERFPAAPLFPGDERTRAQVDVFVEWFNRVWKVAPNAIDALRRTEADRGAHNEITGHAVWLGESVDRFEGLLAESDFLFGPSPTVADFVAFPFVKYALRAPAGDDPDPFHRILHDYLPLRSRHVRLRRWIERVDAFPRAGAGA